MEIRKIVSCVLLNFPFLHFYHLCLFESGKITYSSSFSGNGCREEFEVSLCLINCGPLDVSREERWAVYSDGWLSDHHPNAVVAPGISHVTTGHRSIMISNGLLPLFKLSYPQMVTNIRSNPWRVFVESIRLLGSWMLSTTVEPWRRRVLTKWIAIQNWPFQPTGLTSHLISIFQP